MRRGQIWWADLPDPLGSAPGFTRPVIILSADDFNQSRVATVVVAALTSSLKYAAAPGMVKLTTGEGGVDRPSVINLTALQTVDKSQLRDWLGALPPVKMSEINEQLAAVLGLQP